MFLQAVYFNISTQKSGAFIFSKYIEKNYREVDDLNINYADKYFTQTIFISRYLSYVIVKLISSQGFSYSFYSRFKHLVILGHE